MDMRDCQRKCRGCMAPEADLVAITESGPSSTIETPDQRARTGLVTEQTKLRASLVSPAPLYQAFAGWAQSGLCSVTPAAGEALA